MRIIVMLAAATVVAPLSMGVLTRMAAGNYQESAFFGLGLCVAVVFALFVDAATQGKLS